MKTIISHLTMKLILTIILIIYLKFKFYKYLLSFEDLKLSLKLIKFSFKKSK